MTAAAGGQKTQTTGSKRGQNAFKVELEENNAEDGKERHEWSKRKTTARSKFRGDSNVKRNGVTLVSLRARVCVCER